MVIIEPGIITTEFGDVITGPMLERSGQSAYAKMAQSVAKASKESYEKGNGSPGTLIADTISKAIQSRKPKTRYVKGSMAKPLIFLRWLVSDRMFDKIIMSQVK